MSPAAQGPVFDLHRGRSGDPGIPALRLVIAPRSVRVLASALLGLLVLLIAGLIVTPWQQSLSGHGRVVAFAPVERHQKLEAPVDGRIVRVLALEGQKVLQDEVVVEIADVDPRFLERLESERQLMGLRKEAADARLQSVSDRVVALQQGREMALAAADARVDMAKDRVRQAEQSLVAAEAALDAADLNLPRVQELAAKGLRSTRDAELADLEAKRARADVERLKSSLAASKSEVESLIAERHRVEKDTAASVNDARASEQMARAEIAAAAGELVRIETRISRQQMQAVALLRDAVVFRVLVQEGQLVKQGDALVELVPQTTSRAVELWVDGNDAPLVTPGREVRLQFEGWPALQFVGWPQAARGTFGGRVALVDVHDDGTGRFRVLVQPIDTEPWPSSDVLRQGVRANGWVLLEQVPLGWELWRRLNAFPPMLSAPPSSTTESGAEKYGPKDKGDDAATEMKK